MTRKILFNGVHYNDGNRLTYDKNGCLTSDKDKEISSIQYNSLNLPTYMKLSIASAHVSYKYDSKGNKLGQSKQVNHGDSNFALDIDYQ